MEIPRHWRLQDERYRLEGQICPICGARLFPKKAVCPICFQNGIRTLLKAGLATKIDISSLISNEKIAIE